MKDFDQAEKYANLVINLRGGITSEEFLKYSDFIDSYTDILIATKQFDKFIKFAQDILDKEIFDGDLFKKLLNHDRSKIKQKYIDQLQYVVDTPGIFKNIIEKISKSASALICLAEYNKKQKDLSEKYYVEANKHIASMQRHLFMLDKKCILTSLSILLNLMKNKLQTLFQRKRVMD